MRGEHPDWAWVGDFRVVDGDTLEHRGVHYRLEGYDAPETRVFRSRHDRGLEWARGVKAMYRLAILMSGAQTLCLFPDSKPDAYRGRYAAYLFIDMVDVTQIAVREGWGCRENLRKATDWGRQETPFPDHFPMPPGFDDYHPDPEYVQRKRGRLRGIFGRRARRQHDRGLPT